MQFVLSIHIQYYPLTLMPMIPLSSSFYDAFICANDPFPCLIKVVLTLKFKWNVKSSSRATAEMCDHHYHL